jgi:hypothetical protein
VSLTYERKDAKQAAHTMAASPSHGLASSVETFSGWLAGITTGAKETLSGSYDKALESTTEKVLSSVGSNLFRFIEDPFMPEPFRAWMARMYEWTWASIQDELRSEVLSGFGWGKIHAGAQASRLQHWPRAPALFKCCSPGYSWWGATVHLMRTLRARFLYADQPADGSSWKVLRSPLGLLIFALKLNVTTSVATFALLFILMDKRDEAQLVGFILRFKTFMFIVSGILPAASLGMRTHACLAAVERGQPQLCIDNAASSEDRVPIVLACEVVRLVLILLACFLLAGGWAVGGEAEIAALEYRRLELVAELASSSSSSSNTHPTTKDNGFAPTPAASGCSQAAARAAPLLKIAPPKASGAAASLHTEERGTPRMQHDPRAANELLELKRAEWGAERRIGGVLPYFMIYDLLALLVSVGGWGLLYALPRSCGASLGSVGEAAGTAQTATAVAASGIRGAFDLSQCRRLDTSSPLFWSSLYNLKICYGLLMFPFLVFELPLIGPALTRTRHTAYDQAGMLVIRLSKGDVATLYERTKAAAAPGAAGASATASRSEPTPGVSRATPTGAGAATLEA